MAGLLVVFTTQIYIKLYIFLAVNSKVMFQFD